MGGERRGREGEGGRRVGRGVRMRRMGGKRMVVENKDTFTCTVILVHTYITSSSLFLLFVTDPFHQPTC